MAHIVNIFWSTLTIAAEIISLILIILASAKKTDNAFLTFWWKNGLLFACIVALLATLGSLGYSEVLGYVPCKLCWFERICMYPQVILLAVALYRKEKNILVYSIWLSSIGALIALYHSLLQWGLFPESVLCLNGSGIICTQTFVHTFGYITIPVMALSAFILIIVTATISLSKKLECNPTEQ